MAKVKSNSKKADEKLLDLVEVQHQTKNFFEHNSQKISLIGGGLLLALVGGLAYFFLYLRPRQERAVEQMMVAQQQFEKDSFRLALTNPGGGYSGFLDIIETYSGTKSANLAKYYAGLCYLHLGQFDAAIDYLSDYSPKDEATIITKFGTMGDAYSEKKDINQAISYYQKAIDAGKNELLTAYYLRKLGFYHASQNDNAKAVAQFKKLKNDYPLSPEATDIDKYIAKFGGNTEE